MSATVVWILLALVPKVDDGDLINQRTYMGVFDSEASCRKAAVRNQRRDGVLWTCRAVTPNSDGGDEHYPDVTGAAAPSHPSPAH